ncbi:hypothetical protein ACFSQT_10800 [Mesorhizobium calcicola]|uniref:Uncharacterized protein n=1 Tax=Mesorhizobium calcicola TaxID=1300310 RepID=A0ABW4WC14_9HYPH
MRQGHLLLHSQLSASYECTDETGQHDQDKTSEQPCYSGSDHHSRRQAIGVVADERPNTRNPGGGPYEKQTADAADYAVGCPAKAETWHPAAERNSARGAADKLYDHACDGRHG